ncbi:HWE histidine kinase domain-containing protein [Rhizobium sp. S163]|uniref:sensor histidine kinase n=1 Tax=Rhizobium sp. S163 TaxID=3055039 RepID=UPI0025A961F3|nr:HWE histidine kinase domain-containing protein [Rhizobium sp. S163]MDM9644857.1 HWE histidine kinase domain-containing protein [Rhizobium sp. S163]
MRLKLVAVAVAALAPVLAMSGYNEYAIRQQRGDEVRANAAQAARQASSEVERIVEGLRSLLVAVSSMPSVRHLDAPVCNEALQSLASRVPNIKTLFVLRPDGIPVCGSAEMPVGVSFNDRDYFNEAISTRDFVVGRFTNSRISGSPVLPLAMPLIEDGKVTAVVVSGIRLDWLQTRITERGVAPGNAVTLADRDGTILARVPLPEKFVGTVIPGEYQKLVHADAPGVVEVRSQDGTARVLGYRPISLPANPLYVSAGFSTTEAFAPIDRATLANLVGIATGALISLLLAMFIGRHFLLAPISRISSVLQNWREGRTKSRTMMKPTDELHAVGASLDSLLDELDCRRVQNEKAEADRILLVSELAHRVKNGFALVQAIARQSFARSDRGQYESFSERLLALSSTYDLILSKEGSASPIRGVLEAALRAHSSSADRISLEGPDLVLPADLTMPLSLVIHELATNATKYGSLISEGGTVSIRWTSGSRVHLEWIELGGPAVAVPTRKGFGSVLIERAFPVGAKAKIRKEFAESGLRFEIAFDVTEP